MRKVNVMLTPLALVLLLPIVVGCSSGPIVKAQLDAEVKRLCAVDGGIKVYETVALPAEKLAGYKSGDMRIPLREKLTSQDDFYYKNTIQYLRQNGRSDDGGIDLLRHHYELYRSFDNKLLGETVSYARRGGDVSGPWHPSNFLCPQPKELNLIEHIFHIQQGDKK